MILYIENPKDATRILVELINKFGEVSGYKSNTFSAHHKLKTAISPIYHIVSGEHKKTPSTFDTMETAKKRTFTGSLFCVYY